jgi:hypothetical protein
MTSVIGRALVGALVALAASTFSCAHQEAPIKDARAEAAASASQRLQGRWTLVSFQPETPLEPALQLLLNTQLGHLTAEFNGSKITALGPGVTIERTFRIEEAYENHFKAMVTDAYGVGIETSCDFMGNQLVANGIDAPWRGRATFNKSP